MPRERIDFFRDSNAKEKEKIFILAFEGNNTEDQYFNAFRDSEKFNSSIICLHLLTRAKDDTKSAPKHVFSKLKKEAKDAYNFNKHDELWMIIDTDKWIGIEEIIKECEMHGNMHVAVSNPCFELWLLLHIKDINQYTQEEFNKLLSNHPVSNKKRYIDCEITKILGSYNKSKLVAEHFMGSVHLAIEQAKSLDNPPENIPTKVGSHIYKLMQKISK